MSEESQVKSPFVSILKWQSVTHSLTTKGRYGAARAAKIYKRSFLVFCTPPKYLETRKSIKSTILTKLIPPNNFPTPDPQAPVKCRHGKSAFLKPLPGTSWKLQLKSTSVDIAPSGNKADLPHQLK